MKSFVFFSLFYSFSHLLLAQQNPISDNAVSINWSSKCQIVEVQSSIDTSLQPAYFFIAEMDVPRPLIVSLHTWSGDYEQYDTLSWQCIENRYNYIHPNFRGANNKPDACGSNLVIQDIDDAISYALEHSNVDRNEIHIIGESGGGYATLLAYMNTKHKVKTFSAWVPISDLVWWYQESEGRGSKYAADIAQSTVNKLKVTQKNYSLFEEKAVERSPFYMKTPVDDRQNSKLYIYAGIHDGYTGAVPITQSIRFYNKIVGDFDPAERSSLVPDKDIIEMLSSRTFHENHKKQIDDRLVHYKKTYQDKACITIFEGGHEMIPNVALSHLNARKILTIGDSNGAAYDGWVEQLKKMMSSDFIYNTSISGNTIGFDNNNNEYLNTLRKVNSYLSDANTHLGELDAIVIMLGTNDCKAVFNNRLKEIPENYEQLIKKIKDNAVYKQSQPAIYIVSPPPFGKDEVMLKKYHGGEERIAWLYPKFKEIAKKYNCVFIDTYSTLLPLWSHYAKEGIHPETEGQILMAMIISASIKKHDE